MGEGSAFAKLARHLQCLFRRGLSQLSQTAPPRFASGPGALLCASQPQSRNALTMRCSRIALGHSVDGSRPVALHVWPPEHHVAGRAGSNAAPLVALLRCGGRCQGVTIPIAPCGVRPRGIELDQPLQRGRQRGEVALGVGHRDSAAHPPLKWARRDPSKAAARGRCRARIAPTRGETREDSEHHSDEQPAWPRPPCENAGAPGTPRESPRLPRGHGEAC